MLLEDYAPVGDFREAKAAISDKLRGELEKYEDIEFLNIATLLDVRFKVNTRRRRKYLLIFSQIS